MNLECCIAVKKKDGECLLTSSKRYLTFLRSKAEEFTPTLNSRIPKSAEDDFDPSVEAIAQNKVKNTSEEKLVM